MQRGRAHAMSTQGVLSTMLLSRRAPPCFAIELVSTAFHTISATVAELCSHLCMRDVHDSFSWRPALLVTPQRHVAVHAVYCVAPPMITLRSSLAGFPALTLPMPLVCVAVAHTMFVQFAITFPHSMEGQSRNLCLAWFCTRKLRSEYRWRRSKSASMTSPSNSTSLPCATFCLFEWS